MLERISYLVQPVRAVYDVMIKLNEIQRKSDQPPLRIIFRNHQVLFFVVGADSERCALDFTPKFQDLRCQLFYVLSVAVVTKLVFSNP